MPKFNIIQGGKVVNTIIASHEFINAKYTNFSEVIVVNDTVIRGLTQDEFRKRMETTTLMRLDKLEVKLEVDAVFDALCPGVTPVTREVYRDGMRTAFRNLANEKLIYLDHPIVVTGITLFKDAGVITKTQADTFLDTTDLEV